MTYICQRCKGAGWIYTGRTIQETWDLKEGDHVADILGYEQITCPYCDHGIRVLASQIGCRPREELSCHP